MKCAEVKDFGAFRRSRRKRDGLSSWCAECHNGATRRYRRKRRVEALLEGAAEREREAEAGGLLAASSRRIAESLRREAAREMARDAA